MAISITVFKGVEISAGHFLRDFDYCSNHHGHNYRIELGVPSFLIGTTDEAEGSIGDVPGHILQDFGTMKSDIMAVVGKCDQKLINEVYDEPNPTAEWLAERWLRELNLINTAYTLIRVYESENSFVEASL